MRRNDRDVEHACEPVPQRTRAGRRWGAGMAPLFLAACAAVLTALPPAASAQDRPAAYAYVGAPHVITAEATGAHEFILNFVNLSDYVIVVQPSDFIYKGSSGQFYIGQVFDQPTKTTRGESYRYSASTLLSSHSFMGLNVLGAFHEQEAIVEISVRIGAKRFYLEGLDKSGWEQLGGKVGELDLESGDPSAALNAANLKDIGRLRTADGTSDWDRDWQNQLLADGVNPPRILENPAPAATEEARRTKTYGAVKLSAIVNRDGTVQDVTVVQGLGRGLDERAVEAVKKSWMFLPATKNGEVIETRIKFDVVFSEGR